jgi:hypothetical protein
MNEDLLNILSNSNKDIDNQQLMDYLSGKLSDKERHALEQQMVDSDLLNDAMEGLEKFGDKKDVQGYVEQLNAALQKNLAKKRQRREKRRWKDSLWGYVAVLLIIALCVITYHIIRVYMHRAI